MRKLWRYLSYVVRHKRAVYKAGRFCEVSLWRCIKHDWSKLRPSEFFPYAEFFYGDSTKRDDRGLGKKSVIATEKVQAAFDRAWLLHIHRNDHHYEHWLTLEDGMPNPVKMPEQAWREMCADYLGMSFTLNNNWDAIKWYSLNQNNIVLHDETRFRVESLLKRAGSELTKQLEDDIYRRNKKRGKQTDAVSASLQAGDVKPARTSPEGQ